MGKKLIATCLLVSFCVLAAQPAAANNPHQLAPIISPEMELLAGVLTQTSWITSRGPQGEGNEYFRALRDYFAPYKRHEAITIAQELTNLGFTYDAPVGFICHLGPLPELELKYEYSSYLIERARGRDRLERFRLALADLAREASFLDFYDSWLPQFNEWIAATEFNGDMITDWLEGFFGKQASEFHLIFAPAMFPGGGYGANIDSPNGELISYQILRERGTSSRAPDLPSGRYLEYLSLHEWGHSFVNPVLDVLTDEVSELQLLFTPVATKMRNKAYPDVHVFMNEQVLRAVTTLAAEELYDEETYQEWLLNEEEAGFYLTKDVIGMLREYKSNRDTYPTFESYAPTLLKCLSVLKVPAVWWHKAWPWFFGLAFFGLFLYIRRRRNSIQ